MTSHSEEPADRERPSRLPKDDSPALPTVQKGLVATLSAALVSVVFLVKLHAANFFASGDRIDPVMLTFFVLIACIISGLSGMVGCGSKETSRFRIMLQGIAFPSLILALVQNNLPNLPVIDPRAAAVDPFTLRSPESRAAGALQPGGLFGSAAFAMTPSREAPSAAGSCAEMPALTPPSGTARAFWGLAAFFGRYPSNWFVEVERTTQVGNALRIREDLVERDLEPMPVQALFFSADDPPRWIAPPEPARRAAGRFSCTVLLGSELTARQAEKLLARALRAGVRAVAWQRPVLDPKKTTYELAQVITAEDLELRKRAFQPDALSFDPLSGELLLSWVRPARFALVDPRPPRLTPMADEALRGFLTASCLLESGGETLIAALLVQQSVGSAPHRSSLTLMSVVRDDDRLRVATIDSRLILPENDFLGPACDSRRQRLLLIDRESGSVLAFPIADRSIQRRMGLGSLKGFGVLSAMTLSDADLYVGDNEYHKIYRWNVESGEPGRVYGQTGEVSALAVSEDGSRLFAVDEHRGWIRQYDTATGSLQIVVDDPILRLPTAIAIDSDEAIWIADARNKELYRFSPASPS